HPGVSVAQVVCVCVCVCVCVFTAESGQNINLPCRATNNARVVKWSRADLGTEYVLLYRDGHFDQYKQHPSFKNRVDLQDRQMKDGDVSLILKNVTTNDTGTYECRVVQRGRNDEPICNISLSVVDPPGESIHFYLFTASWLLMFLCVVTERTRPWMQGAEMSFFQRMAEEFSLWKKLKVELLLFHIDRSQLRWFRHLNRMPREQLFSKVFWA
uniref:Ig-like domain-containing protein n=1 Tax=Amphilophus citrinellus TaxID=61819 RepID=A0A3Q0RLD0_AMPCI